MTEGRHFFSPSMAGPAMAGLHPSQPMKKLLFLSLLAALLCPSCRTMTPLDPMTMEPCSRCLPGHYHKPGEQCHSCGEVDYAK